MNFFGLEIAMIGYQGTVFPVLLAVWFMSIVEKKLRRAIPDALDLILTPFLTVIISGFIALLIIGPAGALGDGISFILSTLITHAGWLAGLLFGGLYSVIVIPVFTTASTPSKPDCWATRPLASTSCCRSGRWPTSLRAALVWRCGSKPKMPKSKPLPCRRRFLPCWASPKRRFLVSTCAL
jgi:PTS system sucrose-specific IIC component